MKNWRDSFASGSIKKNSGEGVMEYKCVLCNESAASLCEKCQASYCCDKCQPAHAPLCLAPCGKMYVKTMGPNYAGVFLLKEAVKAGEILRDGPPQMYFSCIEGPNAQYNPEGTIEIPRDKTMTQAMIWMEGQCAIRFPETFRRLRARPSVEFQKNKGCSNSNFEAYLFANAYQMGNEATTIGYIFDEFLGKMNHACQSYNCRWIALPNRFVLVAMRDIEVGEELTIVYASVTPVDFQFDQRATLSLGFKCRCKGHGENLVHCPYGEGYFTDAMICNVQNELRNDPVFDFLLTSFAIQSGNQHSVVTKAHLDAAIAINAPSLLNAIYLYIGSRLRETDDFIANCMLFCSLVTKLIFKGDKKKGELKSSMFFQQANILMAMLPE